MRVNGHPSSGRVPEPDGTDSDPLAVGRRGRRGRRWAFVLAGALVGLALIWLIVSGAAGFFLEEEALRQRIESWGALAPIGFVLAMWIVQPVGVPGVVFMVPASLVWSAPTAIALSWIGNMGASWIAFEVTRSVGQEWVSRRIPERLHRFDDRLVGGGAWPVFVLRIVTGQLPAADWLLGVSSVRRGPFLLGTALGILPGIVVTVLYGADLIGWLRDHPGAAVLVVALLLGRGALRWRRGRRQVAESS